EWMDECFEKHPDCIQRGADFLPTRLLDVGKTIDSKVRLVNSKDIPSRTLPGKYPKFLALSHCWGKSRPSLVLCSSTMDILSTGVELADLPRTFRDASRVTRMLDIRYLWIDSLCIVQDSSADWQKEAAQMDSVYRKAHLTLAAASSTDSEGGLYIDDKLATMSSPLHHRAWILQESILSRRTVYFTKDQLIWECRTKHHLEDGKWKHRDHPAHLKEEKAVLFKTNQWWSWIWDYTNRQLTNPSDRLPAFAGIAKFFA
ncbi:heterokaryon incompatibility protein-domain-containing protein, partial [Phaeosphaeriaceae sp. PMI808]